MGLSFRLTQIHSCGYVTRPLSFNKTECSISGAHKCWPQQKRTFVVKQTNIKITGVPSEQKNNKLWCHNICHIAWLTCTARQAFRTFRFNNCLVRLPAASETTALALPWYGYCPAWSQTIQSTMIMLLWFPVCFRVLVLFHVWYVCFFVCLSVCLCVSLCLSACLLLAFPFPIKKNWKHWWTFIHETTLGKHGHNAGKSGSYKTYIEIVQIKRQICSNTSRQNRCPRYRITWS